MQGDLGGGHGGGGTARTRTGVFGGTFDPIHVGHLVAATWAGEALGLDRVLMVVANLPWQKAGARELTPAEDRFAVVEAAVEGVPGLEACRAEIDRGGPSYTADTVDELLAADPTTTPYVIVGADVAAGLDSWKRTDDLRQVAVLVVVDRGGVPPAPDPPGWQVQRVKIPALDVSSSDLRHRLSEGRPVDFLVPPAAIRCIRRRDLYAGSR
ncbi:MAG: nicotinate-nucleotide adenylyltransferase [Acidimicrobiales bacterium]